MSAAFLALEIERGVSWSLPLTWKNPDGTPVDLTGFSARMEIRAGQSDNPGALALALDSAPAAGSGAIALGGAAGTITPALTPSQAESLAAGTDYCYDLKLTSGGGDVYRPIYGTVTVSEEVTTG